MQEVVQVKPLPPLNCCFRLEGGGEESGSGGKRQKAESLMGLLHLWLPGDHPQVHHLPGHGPLRRLLLLDLGMGWGR